MMDINAKKAEYETQLARLLASPAFQSIQRLQGAIAALDALQKEESDAEGEKLPAKDAEAEGKVNHSATMPAKAKQAGK